MKASFLHRIAALAFVITSLAGPAVAAVPGMKVIKLFSPHPVTEGAFGNACVLTDRYAIVGEPGYINTIAGAVHVFNAATGALVRTIKPDLSAPGDGFGNALAVNGSRLLVWASSGGNGDSVYLMDIATGKQLRKFVPGVGQGDFFFGWSLILTDRHAIISNPDDSSSKGAVYIFDLNTTDPPVKLTPPDGAAGDFFGGTLYSFGSVLLIGAPNHGGKGAVYRYDLASSQMLAKIQPAGLAAGDRFGDRITGWGSSAFVSAHRADTTDGANAGAVYAVSLDGTVESTPFSIDPTPGVDRGFGWLARQEGNLIVWGAGHDFLVADASRRTSLKVIPSEQIGTTLWPDGWSLAGNRLLLSFAFDSTYGIEAGAALVVQLLPEPLGGEVIATKGDSAPGAAAITFNDLKSAAISPTGHVLFTSSLGGSGSNRGRDTGAFDDLAATGLFDLIAKSRDDIGSGVKIASIGAPSLNDANGLFQAKLSGTGVSGLNNQTVLRDDGTAATPLLRTGQTLADFGGANLLSFGQIGQSMVTGNFATPIRLRTGTGGATAASDTGLIFVRETDGAVLGATREGAATPIMGIHFGQFIPRIGYENSLAAFATMLSGPAAENQAVFSKNHTGTITAVARKGSPAPDTGGALFGSFLGETVTSTGQAAFRATLTGSGVTAANNQGVWRNSGGLKLIARTGSPAPVGQTGVVWSRFLQVCPQTTGTILRGLLRGPGITSANDEILCYHRADGTIQILLREGDAVHGCNGAKAGPISRLEVSAAGPYRLIAALAATAASSNLVLLGGDTTLGTDTAASELRKPKLLLRKGALISRNPVTVPARVTSLAFTHAGSQDATGIGCKGLPGVTGNRTLIKTSFSDRSTSLLRME